MACDGTDDGLGTRGIWLGLVLGVAGEAFLPPQVGAQLLDDRRKEESSDHVCCGWRGLAALRSCVRLLGGEGEMVVVVCLSKRVVHGRVRGAWM